MLWEIRKLAPHARYDVVDREKADEDEVEAKKERAEVQIFISQDIESEDKIDTCQWSWT